MIFYDFRGCGQLIFIDIKTNSFTYVLDDGGKRLPNPGPKSRALFLFFTCWSSEMIFIRSHLTRYRFNGLDEKYTLFVNPGSLAHIKLYSSDLSVVALRYITIARSAQNLIISTQSAVIE